MPRNIYNTKNKECCKHNIELKFYIYQLSYFIEMQIFSEYLFNACAHLENFRNLCIEFKLLINFMCKIEIL